MLYVSCETGKGREILFFYDLIFSLGTECYRTGDLQSKEVSYFLPLYFVGGLTQLCGSWKTGTSEGSSFFFI